MGGLTLPRVFYSIVNSVAHETMPRLPDSWHFLVPPVVRGVISTYPIHTPCYKKCKRWKFYWKISSYSLAKKVVFPSKIDIFYDKKFRREIFIVRIVI